MKRKRKIILLFRISVSLMGALSASFMLMPLSSGLAEKYGTRIPLIIVGSIFWCAFIGGYLLFTYVNVLRDKKREENRLPGVIRFFSNKQATIVDILMIIVIIAFICGLIWMKGFILYVFLSLTVLLIQFHATLNGKNYEYIQHIKKEKKHYEKQKKE